MSPFMVEADCRCCQKLEKTGDMWHCKSCWDKWHEGARDKNWLTRKEWERQNPQEAALVKIRAKRSAKECIEAYVEEFMKKNKKIIEYLAKR